MFPLLLSNAASAQINDEINAGLQFSFSPPGARSLAMGSAFSGLADDATAAYSNPAGLLWISRPEVSVESRLSSFTTVYPDSGSASGSPRHIGIDTRDDLVVNDNESRTAGLSYLAYVHVPAKRWRFAVYRHEFANFESEITSQGPFIRSTLESGETRSRLAAVSGSLDLEILSLGAAVAYAVSENLWAGLALSFYDFDYHAITRRFVTTEARSPVSQAVFDRVELSDVNESDRSLQRGADDDIALIAGLLWTGARDRWSVGLVYRQAPTFDFSYEFEWRQRSRANAAGDTDGDGFLDAEPNLDYVDPGIERALSGHADFETPDIISLGVAFRPLQTFTVSFEWARVAYSNLEPESNALVFALENPNSCGDFDSRGSPQTVPCVTSQNRLERFEVDDADELHIGFELIVGERLPFALRAGAWFDPDHKMTFSNPQGIGPPEDRFEPRFRPGDDEMHITLGFGFATERFQLDVAVDSSDRADVASLSGVVRF